MLTSLDLLIILFLVLGVLSLLSLVLLWAAKKPLVRRICLFVLAAAGLYLAAMGAYIGRFVFVGQTVAAIVLGLAAIAAVVLELKGKGNKAAIAARCLASVSVVLGIFTAFG